MMCLHTYCNTAMLELDVAFMLMMRRALVTSSEAGCICRRIHLWKLLRRAQGSNPLHCNDAGKRGTVKEHNPVSTVCVVVLC